MGDSEDQDKSKSRKVRKVLKKVTSHQTQLTSPGKVLKKHSKSNRKNSKSKGPHGPKGGVLEFNPNNLVGSNFKTGGGASSNINNVSFDLKPNFINISKKRGSLGVNLSKKISNLEIKVAGHEPNSKISFMNLFDPFKTNKRRSPDHNNTGQNRSSVKNSKSRHQDYFLSNSRNLSMLETGAGADTPNLKARLKKFSKRSNPFFP
jgi:hypothetical protein